MISTNENLGGISAGLNAIEKSAKSYADIRAQLAVIIGELTAAQEALLREKMPIIKKLVGRAAEKHSELNALIAAAPDQFKSPRSVIFHGIKVGFRKGSGGIDWDDDAKVCELIEKHFTENEAELLIKTVKKPIATALADLDVADLKRIGCRVEATGDVVLIKPVDTAVEKSVKALLKSAVDEAEVKA